MGKRWARQEAKKNELAQFVDKVTLWVRANPQPAIWSGIGFLAAILIGVAFLNRHFARQEDSWTQFAIAQSYAYSGQPKEALEQARKLGEEYPASAASTYGLLLTGDILYEQKKYPEAAQVYQQVLDAPNHKAAVPLAMANLGISREAMGDCKAAVSTDRDFLDLYQEHFLAPAVHTSLARCLTALGQRDQAKATFERIAFLYPQTYWAQWAKARLKG